MFEAITLLHFENYHYIKKKLPLLGDIKLVQCNFSQYSRRYAQYKKGNILPAFSPELSGGALYDLNVYNIHFVMGLFGQPESINYHANIGHNGIDTSGICTMRYQDFVAVCSAAKDSTSPSFATIQGDKGYIKVNGATNFCHGVELHTEDITETFDISIKENHMIEEFRNFARMFDQADFESCYRYLHHSVSVMQTIEKARLDAGVRFSCD